MNIKLDKDLFDKYLEAKHNVDFKISRSIGISFFLVFPIVFILQFIFSFEEKLAFEFVLWCEYLLTYFAEYSHYIWRMESRIINKMISSDSFDELDFNVNLLFQVIRMNRVVSSFVSVGAFAIFLILFYFCSWKTEDIDFINSRNFRSINLSCV